jgi:uncharacterized membrane protein HdeD (DUF308 family)
MLRLLASKWWIFLVRGLCAIAFGILAFALPGAALLSLALIWGAYALLDGAAALVAALSAKGEEGHFWQLLIAGILGLLAGVLTFAWPGLTALFMLYLVAWWAVFRGVFEIAAAVRLRREIENEWLLGLAGALSVIFGLVLMFQPAAGAVAIVWLLAGFAIAFGVFNIALAFRLKGLHHRLGEVGGRGATPGAA